MDGVAQERRDAPEEAKYLEQVVQGIKIAARLGSSGAVLWHRHLDEGGNHAEGEDGVALVLRDLGLDDGAEELEPAGVVVGGRCGVVFAASGVDDGQVERRESEDAVQKVVVLKSQARHGVAPELV